MNDLVIMKDKQAVTSSLQVAKTFGNNHRDVLRAIDVASALGYSKPRNAISNHVEDEDKTTALIQGPGSNYKSKAVVISEFGIYDLVFSSKLPAAKQFKRWVFTTIQQLRKSTGLDGFEVFRMMDKQHQKDAMKQLRDGLKQPVRVNFIKANTVANKAVSTKYGYLKMVKKGEMTPAMLADREAVLDDTVKMMEVNDRYNLGLSVSKAIYASLAKTHPA